jgi:putative holliday junction resolvase
VEIKQLLGLDVGQKRIGVARASSAAKLAEPLITIKSENALNKLDQIVKEQGAETVVVGLPRNLKGDDTAQTAWVRQWVDGAKKQIKLPFYWQDEALTSRIAEVEREAHKSAHDVDALAAAIILQDFLDAPEAQRVPC